MLRAQDAPETGLASPGSRKCPPEMRRKAFDLLLVGVADGALSHNICGSRSSAGIDG